MLPKFRNYLCPDGSVCRSYVLYLANFVVVLVTLLTSLNTSSEVLFSVSLIIIDYMVIDPSCILCPDE